MRKVLIALIITGCFYSLFATDSRVLTMGRSDNFFMDDISVFRNPANVSIYPNMLMGSMGIYKADTSLDTTGQFSGLANYNRDPQKPYFGGILSYSLNQSADAGDQYPMLSLGLVFNRYDDMLDYITPTSDKFFGTGTSTIIEPATYLSPVGKVDLILGLALKNGGMIGLGGYLAFQKEKDNEQDGKETKLYKGTAGVNWPVAKTMDLEVSVNGGLTTKIGESRSISTTGDTSALQLITAAENDIFVSGDIRLFSALSSLNGDFVPHIGFDLVQYNEGENRVIDFDAGFAININIDRGFFWAGVEGFYEDYTSKKIDNKYTSLESIGARICFGIERNIIWDWFVWRVGATKKLAFQKVGGQNGTTIWVENPEADASDEDHVAFGFGLNIENRLKVDAVMAEDIFYTFTNLISGNHHHITSRITATYSF